MTTEMTFARGVAACLATGVTSYYKRRSGPAKLWGPNFRHNVTAGKHNLPSSINDRSSYLQLF